MSGAEGRRRGSTWPVEERPAFHRRDYFVQRFGWSFMGLVFLLGLLGLWGDGVLSDTTAHNDQARLTVSYERFVRNTGLTTLQLRISHDVRDEDVVAVRVSQEYLSDVEITGITPQPERVTSDETDLRYEFPVRDNSQLVVTFDLRPQGYGTKVGTIRLSDEAVVFQQFVYP
jgi:hypothetical protein